MENLQCTSRDGSLVGCYYYSLYHIFCSFRCMEAEDEQLITPCSVFLLRVQMRKALRRMTQQSAQLVLVSTRLKKRIVAVLLWSIESKAKFNNWNVWKCECDANHELAIIDAIWFYTGGKRTSFIQLIFILPKAYAGVLSVVVCTLIIPLQKYLGKSALHLLAWIYH